MIGRAVAVLAAMLACGPAWAALPLEPSAAPVTVRIDGRRRVTLDGAPTSEPGLLAALARVTGGDRDRPIVLQPTSTVRFGQVEGILHRLGDAGYTRVMLRPVDGKGKAQP